MAGGDDLVGRFAQLGILADLGEGELCAIMDGFEIRSFLAGHRILRRGDPGIGLFIIAHGEVDVVIDDEERATLATGSFFGEVSALLGEPLTADIVTRTRLHCLFVPVARVEEFLIAHPRVMYRMFQTEARRLRTVDPQRD